MKVLIERPRQELTLEFEGIVSVLLEKLKVNPEEVIVSRNGSLVTLDEALVNDDKIEILSVVSGG